jgi:hypothetical protein
MATGEQPTTGLVMAGVWSGQFACLLIVFRTGLDEAGAPDNTTGHLIEKY